MIVTKVYQLVKKEYIHIVLHTLLKNMLKLIPFVLIWSLLLSWYFGTFFMICCILSLCCISILLLCWSSIKNLNPFFEKTTLQFNEDFMHISKNNGTIQWNFNRLKKIVEEKNYWLVYMTNVQYVYIPKDIFFNNNDQAKFRSLLKI